MLHQDLWTDSGLGMALDGGVQVRAPLEDLISLRNLGWFSFGSRLSNFANSGMRWDGGRDALNFNYTFGVAWENEVGDLSWILSRDRVHHYTNASHTGVEVAYRHFLSLRLGQKGFGGELTYGAGFRFSQFEIDYAGLAHDLGRVHRMSFNYKF